MTDFFGFGEERCNHCVISHKDPSKTQWLVLSNKLMRHRENIGCGVVLVIRPQERSNGTGNNLGNGKKRTRKKKKQEKEERLKSK